MDQNKNTTNEENKNIVKTDKQNYKTIISNNQELLILVVTICIVVFSIFITSD